MNRLFKFSFAFLLMGVVLMGCGGSEAGGSSDDSASSFGEMSGTAVGDFVGTFYTVAKAMNGEFDSAMWDEVNAAQSAGPVTIMGEASMYFAPGEMDDNASLYLTVPDGYGNSSVQCYFKGTENLDKIVIDDDNEKYSTVAIKGTFDDAMLANLSSETSMGVSISLKDCELVGVK